jgi:hypothetical protein
VVRAATTPTYLYIPAFEEQTSTIGVPLILNGNVDIVLFENKDEQF